MSKNVLSYILMFLSVCGLAGLVVIGYTDAEVNNLVEIAMKIASALGFVSSWFLKGKK